MIMLFNATFNNISVISWRSILLVEESGVHGENKLCVKNPSRQNVIDLNGDKLCGSVSMTYFCLLKCVILIIPNEMSS